MTGKEGVPPRLTGGESARGPPAPLGPDTRKTGLPPRSSVHRRRQRRTKPSTRSVPGRRTESTAGSIVCAHSRLGLSVIASATRGAGDGPQQHADKRVRAAEASVSYTAIAAVLARTDLSIGERLVARSLASFANREERALTSGATSRPDGGERSERRHFTTRLAARRPRPARGGPPYEPPRGAGLRQTRRHLGSDSTEPSRGRA